MTFKDFVSVVLLIGELCVHVYKAAVACTDINLCLLSDTLSLIFFITSHIVLLNSEISPRPVMCVVMVSYYLFFFFKDLSLPLPQMSER